MSSRTSLFSSMVIMWATSLGIGLSHIQPAGGAEPMVPPVLLQMARDPAIHAELGLSPEQAETVLDATDQVDVFWWPSRNLPAEERSKVIDDLTSRLWKDLITILDADQRARCVQLQRQALGTRMFLRAELADELRLSPEVREKLRQLALETDEAVLAAEKKLAAGGKPEEVARDLEKLKEHERREVVSLLTVKQQQQVGTLVGQAFNFAKVTRTQPRAPEFIADAGSWLQGRPLKMQELRGKVVVVHFYAYECINCIRNLPHYNGWATDFSSEDVVIVGIQTPETSRERDPQNVKRALGDKQIEYPVVFDPQLDNWKAWGNTMWPTVYLVDRSGFIRTWWQGELNFQGATGEQKFREIIRKMVQEEPR